MLDIGGGFPARYVDGVPSIEQIGARSCRRWTSLLPYRPELLAAEPGRHLVAETAVMAATVIGREERGGEEWLYLDVGAYNGLMETLQTGGRWRIPLWTSRADHGVVPTSRSRSPGRAATARTPCSTACRCRPRSTWATALHRLGRGVHAQLRLRLQRFPAARDELPAGLTGSSRGGVREQARRRSSAPIVLAGWMDSLCLSFAWTLILLGILDRYGLPAAGCRRRDARGRRPVGPHRQPPSFATRRSAAAPHGRCRRGSAAGGCVRPALPRRGCLVGWRRASWS